MVKIFLIVFSVAFSSTVSIDRARSVAENLLLERKPLSELDRAYNVIDSKIIDVEGVPVFYVFNFNPVGYAVISADDRVIPVIAYSYESSFDFDRPEDMPIQFSKLLDSYGEQVYFAISNDLPQTEKAASKWKKYLNFDSSNFDRPRSVEPLITAKFDQGTPWNGMIPSELDIPVGCVAVSMVQVMHYWKYPVSSSGSYNYYDYPIGTLSGTLNAYYDWYGMPDTSPSEDTQLVLFNAGVAVEMDYGVDGSGAYLNSGYPNARLAMRDNFDYDSGISGRNRSTYSTANWIALMKSEIDQGRPIIYDGFPSDGAGHAWNVDGYQDDELHMNYGWGGSYNGYTTVDDIVYDMNEGHGALIYIEPDNLNVPNLNLASYSTSEYDGDGDMVVNPGEVAQVSVDLSNNFAWPDAQGVSLILAIDGIQSGLSVLDDFSFISTVESGSSASTSNPFTVEVDESVELGVYPLTLVVQAQNGYARTFEIMLNVSIDQSGFPFDADSEIKGSPLVVDFNGDGEMDIIFGDYLGRVHILDKEGQSQDFNGAFPYETGDQIWGSPAMADIDNDGLNDFVVASKSKSMYIFDENGLKLEYLADSWLIGNPAIGNLDNDDDLEVVVAGYSSSNKKLFAINPDGTDVEGFPFDVGERTLKGVALADFNGNGKDDIVLGDDGDYISLVYDDGSLGWSYQTSDKVQTSPSVLNVNGENIIFAGNKDGNFYSLDSNGGLRFMIETGDDINVSASFLEYNGSVSIFFGSDNGNIYGVDLNGNSLSGWPVQTGGKVTGAIAFADLDGNGTPSIISSNQEGLLLAYNLEGLEIQYFPIEHENPYSGSPSILDIDDDGDLEILAGSSLYLVVNDYKSNGSVDLYWNTDRGDYRRTGYYVSSSSGSCDVGDINGDSIYDILDVVSLVNIVMGNLNPNADQECAADLNGDGISNVLDIVGLVNVILDN